MKLPLSILAAALIGSVTGAAHASSADLMVTGTIAPASCFIGLTNAGAIDLGQIDLQSLSDVADTPLPDETMGVTITCSAPVKVVTSVTDDRSGTASTVADDNFGLNLTADSNPIGFYKVFAESGLADTVAAEVIASTNLSTWTTAAGGTPVAHTGSKYTAVGDTTGGPASAAEVKWTLRIEPTITSSTNLALTGQQAIDGRMTLTLMYL